MGLASCEEGEVGRTNARIEGLVDDGFAIGLNNSSIISSENFFLSLVHFSFAAFTSRLKDVARCFVGKWYCLGHIPTYLERIHDLQYGERNLNLSLNLYLSQNTIPMKTLNPRMFGELMNLGIMMFKEAWSLEYKLTQQ